MSILLPIVQHEPGTSRARNTSRPVMLVGFENQGNLGLGYLASVLRQHGYTVHVVDIEQEPESIVGAALEFNPILIGFSLIFQFYIDRYAYLLGLMRAAGVECHFTMGGHFPSLSYQQTLELVPELDSVVRFEGEMTLLELADAIGTDVEWRSVQGIAHREQGHVVATPARRLLDDLDQLPHPERNYHPKAVLGRNMMPIVASRGCARTCSFCSIHTFYRAAPGKIVRTRRPAAVVEEMRALYEQHDTRIFLFQDDDFPLFGPVWKRWATAFVEELHRSGLSRDVIWKMNCRADAVDRGLFMQMRDAGLYLVYMGLESGSEDGLETLHKQITVEQNLAAVQLLKSLGLMWEYGFMLLDPSSTFESVRENLGFLRTILADGSCRRPSAGCSRTTARRSRMRSCARDVCAATSAIRDYDFLDPRLSAFYEGLTEVVSLTGWIHGLEAVTLQLGCAWHEVAVMERLFPPLPGMLRYKQRLRRITKRSNHLLLTVVEDLSYVYSDGRGNLWDPADIERRRVRVIDDLLTARNEFVLQHQHTLLGALGITKMSSVTDDAVRVEA